MSKNLRTLINDICQEQMLSTPSAELTDFLQTSFDEEIDSLIDRRIKIPYVNRKVMDFNKLKEKKGPQPKVDKGPSPAKNFRSAIQERVVEIMNMTPTHEFNEYLQSELDEEIDSLVQKKLTVPFILQKIKELSEKKGKAPKGSASPKSSEEPVKPGAKASASPPAEKSELSAAS